MLKVVSILSSTMLRIDRRTTNAFSTPDGSCLLVLVADETHQSQQKLLAFHWSSFGSNLNNINPIYLPHLDSGRVITSFEDRSSIHLLSLEDNTIKSTALQIRQTGPALTLRSNQTHAPAARLDTTNNCLIDCHQEMWTHFPVVPTISRITLLSLGRKARMLAFVSPVRMEPLEDYFGRMVSKFGRTIRKPMDEALSRNCALATSSLSNFSIERVCSVYALGSFIAELLCLIPIQYALLLSCQYPIY